MKKKGLSKDITLTETSSDSVYGIISTNWNSHIVDILKENALSTLLENGVKEEHIIERIVPGAFELPVAAKNLCPDVDAVIALGAIIKGETPHFDFISQACSIGLMQASLDSSKPVLFGVLTTENEEQALDRSLTEKGNKGRELALSALQMVELLRK
ncbi:MAG: 6,7-dimethyl-8-ribityllumazine synthase [Gammaproteobacteria bacterium]